MHRPTRSNGCDSNLSSSSPHTGLRSMFKRIGTDPKSLWKKPVPLSPGQVANRIRELRRHAEISISQRHSLKIETSDSDKLVLKELSTTLLELCRSPEDVTRAEARNEVFSLAINDPLVREVLRICASVDNLADVKNGVSHAISDAVEPVHCLWSEFIGLRAFETRDEAPSSEYCNSLKATLSDFRPDCFFLASEYLAYALALELEDRQLKFLSEIWDYYVDYLVHNDSPFKWDKMNSYVRSITSSNKSLVDFVSPAHLRAIAPFLMRKPYEFIPIFERFLSIPEIQEVRATLNGLELERGYHSYTCANFICLPNAEWNVGRASHYALDFVKALNEKNLNSSALVDTVLFSKNWMSLFRIVDYASSNYRRCHGRSAKVVELAETKQLEEDLILVAGMATEFSSPKDHLTVAAFYLAHSIGVDRYCKKMVHMSWGRSLANHQDSRKLFTLVNTHFRRIRKEVAVLHGIDDIAYIPYFRNVPYLRRFRFRGTCSVTSDSLPEFLMNAMVCASGGTSEDIFVDTMVVDDKGIICLRVDGAKFHFDETGHFPILAGYGAFGEPLYIASVRVGDIWHFTTVTNDAAEATYIDEVGDVHTVQTFFVLALRHDPTDLRPPHPRKRPGAMDPTGPFFWLKFWPKKDPDYFEDERLRDDRLLEPILDEFFTRFH
ncbi:hypothetical protein SCHPADRAFT_1000526 [Schizopora paradoxa]|uniref:Uncharacterized protein n=1 Tax=Schizopora paradoxa TaxID=27342 RepID=A0A0H2RW79_9AGAM|nr:hypothetical protein SCHPADRAFT_1000526 [Schizopora paradoxa]